MSSQTEFNHLNGPEKQQAENDVTKIKLMLEKGARFESDGSPIDPFIEKEMLDHVLEFERQAENPRFIKLFDKLARPSQFLPVALIPDEAIDKAWEQLAAYMDTYGVNLDVCSPNISTRELYRFATEELFDLQINDFKIPGMKCVFIYDEFYPDPFYDNTRTAIDDCIRYILEKKPMEWVYNFRETALQLNQHSGLSIETFKTRVDQYKEAYDEIDIREIKCTVCQVDGDESMVAGEYEIRLIVSEEVLTQPGKWKVCLEQEKESGYWFICNVQIEGISF